jgi:glutaredoxin
MLFCLSTCEDCKRAKFLLAKSGVMNIGDCALDVEPNGVALAHELHRMAKTHTVPQVFMKGKLLPGGLEGLKHAIQTGLLKGARPASDALLSSSSSHAVREPKHFLLLRASDDFIADDTVISSMDFMTKPSGASPNPLQWTANDVATWVAAFGFAEYCETIKKQDVTGLALLHIQVKKLIC